MQNSPHCHAVQVTPVSSRPDRMALHELLLRRSLFKLELLKSGGRKAGITHSCSSLQAAQQLGMSSGTGSSRVPAAAALEGVTYRPVGTPSRTRWLMPCPWALLVLANFILIALSSGDGVTVVTRPAAKSFHS